MAITSPKQQQSGSGDPSIRSASTSQQAGPKLRLKTYITNDIAGLTLEVADIDHDTRADLVINSATSPLPVAIWLNRGAAKFQTGQLIIVRPCRRSQRTPLETSRNRPRLSRSGTCSVTLCPRLNLPIVSILAADFQNILFAKADPLPFDFRVPQAAPEGHQLKRTFSRRFLQLSGHLSHLEAACAW